MFVGKSNSVTRETLVCAKRTAKKLYAEYSTPGRRLLLSRQLLERSVRNPELIEFHQRIEALDVDARHYWIGTLYTLLLSARQRREQAAYFTPPVLSRSILSLLLKEGFDPKTHSVIDPAAGGAAFLSNIAATMQDAGCTGRDVIRRLSGIEIDSGLAQLSEMLIGSRLNTNIRPGEVVSRANSLTLKPLRKHDVVVANPPFGRMSLSAIKNERWHDVCHPGHINKYALFAELCLRLAKPDALVALVLPSSFIGGPLYDRLRSHLRKNSEILMLGSVFERDDVFVDVSQDISILIARAGSSHNPKRAVVFSRCLGEGLLTPVSAAPLPESPSEPWVAPAHVSGRCVGGSNLEGYGAIVRSGYFVWNREQHRMLTAKKRKLDVPLIWAKNIRAGSFCFPRAKKREGVDYVRFSAESSAIVRTNALVIQRTTNNSQSRRLIAARVSPKVIKKYGGFVSENHTIVITAQTSRDLILLATLLNSEAVDRRYRELSGTASISVSLLRRLDLPQPSILREALNSIADTEVAIETAYERSMAIESKAVA